MNAELLQNFHTGLETLMRERRQLLARRVLAVDPKPLLAALPLTRPSATLSPTGAEGRGEGATRLMSTFIGAENRSPVGPQLNALRPLPVPLSKLSETGGKDSGHSNCGTHALLFPLPPGEGQGEGKATIQREMGGTGLRPVVTGVPPETVVGRGLALAAADNHHGNISDEIRRDAGFDGRDARATSLRSSPK
jgi:hypothetical protein